MGLGGQTSTTKGNTTGTSTGTYGVNRADQYGNQINYLDPYGIRQAKDMYGNAIGQSSANTGAANQAAGGFYSGLLSSGGYSPQVQSAISQTSNDAENQKLAEGQHRLAMHGAATNNDAGFAGATANLFGTAATDQAARTRENQIAFANEAQRQKELGGAGMERLLGVNQAAQLGLMGQNAQLAQLRSGEQGTSGGTVAGTNAQNTAGTHGQTTTGGVGSAGGQGGGVGDLLCQLFKIGCAKPAGGCQEGAPDPTTGLCKDGSKPKGGGGGPGGGGGDKGPGGGGKGPSGCDSRTTCCPDNGDTAENNPACGGGGGCDSATECCPENGDTMDNNPNCGSGGGKQCPPGMHEEYGVCVDDGGDGGKQCPAGMHEEYGVCVDDGGGGGGGEWGGDICYDDNGDEYAC